LLRLEPGRKTMIKSTFNAAAATAIFLMIISHAEIAGAGSFQVNPIRVEMSANVTSGALTIRNDGDEPVVVQLSVLAWSQESGEDKYSATTEALVTPPIATIAAGAQQIVRVGLRRPPDPRRELAFRLFVQEVPPPPKPNFNGLQVALRVGLPVFVAPLAPSTRQLAWSAKSEPNNTIRLTVRNTGNTHVQISDFELRPSDDELPVAHEAGLAYALAGESREWLLRSSNARSKTATELRLKAITDAGEIQTVVKLDR
jgi:fimbrial chaperone protein